MMSPKDILKRLENESRKITLAEGLEIEVYGLTFPELAHIAPHIDRKNTEYVLNYIAKVTLKKAFKDWSDKEIDEFVANAKPNYLIKIINAVKEISLPEGEPEKNLVAPEMEQ